MRELTRQHSREDKGLTGLGRQSKVKLSGLIQGQKKPSQTTHCTEEWRCLVCANLLRWLSSGGILHGEMATGFMYACTSTGSPGR